MNRSSQEIHATQVFVQPSGKEKTNISPPNLIATHVIVQPQEWKGEGEQITPRKLMYMQVVVQPSGQ